MPSSIAREIPRLVPLIDTAIKAAQPAAKIGKYVDGSGLYPQLLPTGGKRWRMKYHTGGREKPLFLGTYPALGLKRARA